MKKNKKIPNTPKYKFGGFQKLEKGLKDYGLGLADQSLGMLGASNVIKDSQYSDTGFGNFMKKGSAIGGKIGEQVLPYALGAVGVPPTVTKGAQSLIGQFNPQDPSQYDEQGNPINPNMQQAIGMAGQIGSMAGGFMGKYGGQMKYAMGGMKPNSEVEGNEMITSDTPPQVFNNGGVELASNNPYGTPTYKTNGASHENGGIPMNMAPGSIINGKLKNPLTGNKFTKDVDVIAKMENKYTKKAEAGDKYSKTNAKLILPILAQKKDYLNNLQNAIIANKEQAKALRNGQLPQVPMDNEQMESQGMSGQPQGEMPMARHGGMFAMGGVQLPYYNTDNAGNPIYAMGGGYPAMTNPYHNFRGSIPMYEDGGNMSVDPPVLGDEPKGAVKVAAVGSNYKPLGSFGNKEYFDKESDKAISGGSGAGSDWENSIIKRLQSGVSIEELVKGGHGTSEGLAKYAPYYKPVYIEKFDNNTTTPSGKYDQKIDRKQVFNTTTNNPYIKYFDYPDANAGYSKATRVAVDAKTGKPVDPIKSFDAKGNYVPSFTIDTGRDYYENTIKSSVPGTNPTNLRLENTGNLRTEAIQTGGFKYGGQMPKYVLGGWVPKSNLDYSDEPSFGYVPQTQMEANKMYQMEQNRENPQFATLTSERMQPVQITNPYDTPGLMNAPVYNPSKYGTGHYDPKDQELRGPGASIQELPAGLPQNQNGNKPNWMDIVGKGVNFAAQNMGNIYDLSRKDAPLQSYERATGKFLDPTQARRDEQYAYRQANKAIPGLVGGSGGAAMNLLGANRAKTSTNIGRINKEYENANAQIGNQLNQFNTEIAYREAEARAKDAAMKENIRSQAIHGIGTSVGKATKSGKEDVMDQKTLEMYKQYYNNPQFRAALKKAGYDV